MKASELIAIFNRMYNEHWAYEYGAARDGCVDCSGAFTYAFGKFGQSIAHGSNTIARSRIQGGVRKASEAKPGWAVFKWREANDSMPEKYRNDGLGDYYHIGLLAADGQSVLNAKGEAYGFCRDPLSKWAYAAPLKGVDYDKGSDAGMEEAIYRALVTTEMDPLRVRAAPVTGEILGKVPRGRTVDVLDDDGAGWPRIRYGELEGYASGAYLQRIGGAETDKPAQAHPPDDSGDDNSVILAREEIIEIYCAIGDAYNALGNAYKVIGKALGVD